ncbi:uncharacterized protein [Asterias amurensis]|uniref:uncharacterized protein n=1 Tax=Asterias amurensis TaxID=7602 RepID=UPI003AB5AC92
MLHMPSVRDRYRRSSLGQVSGGVAIHDAVVKGKIHLAKFILDAVDSHTVVNSRDTHGKTPLIRAVRIDEPGVRAKAVDLLLKYQADVNLADNVGRTALSYACEHKCNDVIKKLVKNNVDPNLPDKNGNTPLMYCAMNDNTDGIELLSKSFRRLGLDVDKMNAEGMTPLMVAARNGYAACAQLLAQKAKACLFTRDNVHNMTAIDWAREAGCSTPDVEAIQARPRTATQGSLHDLAEGQDSQRMLPKRDPISPNRNKKSEFSSMVALPSGDSDGSTSSESTSVASSSCTHTHTGSMQNIKQSNHMSLEGLSKRFQGLGQRSSSEDTGSPKYGRADSQSPETPEKELVFGGQKAHQPTRLSDSQHKLTIGSTDVPSHYERNHNVYKHVHHPIASNHSSRRPMSANVTNRESTFSKSFDSVLSTRLSTSSDTLHLLTVTQPLVPHPPTTAKEVSNLSKLSHLSRSMEVLHVQKAPTEPKEAENDTSKVSYVDLQEVRGRRRTEGQASLSPGDLSSLYGRPDGGGGQSSSSRDFGHLPSLSPRCVSRES